MSHTNPCKPQIILTLQGKAMTTREIAKVIGREHETVAKILREMTVDRAYICAWDGPNAVWTLGKGSHTPRPATELSKKELISRKKRSQVDYLNTKYVHGERVWGI